MPTKKDRGSSKPIAPAISDWLGVGECVREAEKLVRRRYGRRNQRIDDASQEAVLAVLAEAAKFGGRVPRKRALNAAVAAASAFLYRDGVITLPLWTKHVQAKVSREAAERARVLSEAARRVTSDPGVAEWSATRLEPPADLEAIASESMSRIRLRLGESLNALSDRDRGVVLRRSAGETSAVIAADIGLTRQRVDQIWSASIRGLRETLADLAVDWAAVVETD